METNPTLNAETINRIEGEGDAPNLNLVCNSDACYIATSEYEMVYFSQMSSGDSTETLAE